MAAQPASVRHDGRAADDKLADAAVEGSDAQKQAEIIDACTWGDVARLRSLADSPGGFLTDALRRAAWPILLGLPSPLDAQAAAGRDAQPHAATPGQCEEKPDGQAGAALAASDEWEQLPRHRDEDQVQLDVNRSFIYYPDDLSDAQLQTRKSELSSLIAEVLRRYPYLCYFQGFHDICQVFLLVLDPPRRAPVVARLCLLRIRDFMLPTLAPTTAQLRLLPDILACADAPLRRHLAGVEPFYALAGTLTMYAHNIEGYGDIARLFDVFLAREPAFSIYMFAQIVIDRRDEIFQFDEPDMLHVLLGRLPAKMDLDALITRSVALFNRYPPETLPTWRHISGASALKTARDADSSTTQTLEQGRLYFDRQAKELKWAEVQHRVKLALWSYRRPAGAVGMAVAVGAFAIYLRRNPTVLHYLTSLFSR